MSKRLEGRVAIVTGAGTGIGEAIARSGSVSDRRREAIAHKFAKEGAKTE